MASSVASEPLPQHEENLQIEAIEDLIPAPAKEFLSKFQIDPFVLATAIMRRDTIEVSPQYLNQELEPCVVGEIATGVRNLRIFFKKHNIPVNFDMEQAITGIKINIKVILSEFSEPRLIEPRISELISQASRQSKEALCFYATMLDLKGEEITIEKLILEGFYNGRYGLPPLREKDATYVQRPHPLPQTFDFRAIVSPMNSLAPSPAPQIVQSQMKSIPEDLSGNSSHEEHEEATDDNGFTLPKNRRSTSHPKQFFGGSPNPPLSAEVGSSYNNESTDEGIMAFTEYFENGIRKKLSHRTIFGTYTSRVQAVHVTLRGKPSTDPRFRKYMKNKLGEHFTAWAVQYPV
jgi:hypothetical protein